LRDIFALLWLDLKDTRGHGRRSDEIGDEEESARMLTTTSGRSPRCEA
jgi:hypothetical protein